MDAMTSLRLTNALQGTSATRNATQQKEATRQVSRAFVGFFMGQMMKSMRSTVQTSEIGHGGQGEELFQSLADEEMAMESAQSESYGLSELVYKSLLRRTGVKGGAQ